MVGRRGVGSLSRLRDSNIQQVFEVLRVEGAVTQAEIARATRLSPATVSNIVGELRSRGIVRTSRGGGRAVALSLDPTAGVVIGVDFGNRHRRMAVSDLAHNILAEERHPLDPGHHVQEGVAATVAGVDRLLAECGRQRSEVLAVAVGLPGPVDPATGQVGSSGILPGWADVHIGEAFESALGVHVAVDNDANLGALGEMHWGAGRGFRDFTYLKVTTGIGAGLVLDGSLYRGAAGTAGEIGHTTIDENGPVCRCGNRGCLELFAATPALLDLLRQRDEEVLTVRDLLEFSEAGDPGCRRVLEDAGRHIGVALANLCNLISPRLIIVGGELVGAGDALLQPMRESMARRAVPAAGQRAEIVPGALADRASVLGAVALALLESAHHLVTPSSARGGDGPEWAA
jgi:predicted NBD/HSP70 family sugar kinase